MKINYATINAQALNRFLSVKKHVSSIDDDLKALIELRVSQINGCAYCVDLHATEARNAAVSQQRLDCLVVWKESQLFSAKEMAALAWAEAVTNISSLSNREELLQQVLGHFSETEVVDLTVTISLMNAMNRMAISMGDTPSVKA